MLIRWLVMTIVIFTVAKTDDKLMLMTMMMKTK